MLQKISINLKCYCERPASIQYVPILDLSIGTIAKGQKTVSAADLCRKNKKQYFFFSVPGAVETCTLPPIAAEIRGTRRKDALISNKMQ